MAITSLICKTIITKQLATFHENQQFSFRSSIWLSTRRSTGDLLSHAIHNCFSAFDCYAECRVIFLGLPSCLVWGPFAKTPDFWSPFNAYRLAVWEVDCRQSRWLSVHLLQYQSQRATGICGVPCLILPIYQRHTIFYLISHLLGCTHLILNA